MHPHLMIYARDRYEVTDRVELFAAAQALALKTGEPLPVDVPSAVRTVLAHVEPAALRDHPGEYGLTLADGALMATLHPATRRPLPPGRVPPGGTLVLEAVTAPADPGALPG